MTLQTAPEIILCAMIASIRYFSISDAAERVISLDSKSTFLLFFSFFFFLFSDIRYLFIECAFIQRISEARKIFTKDFNAIHYMYERVALQQSSKSNSIYAFIFTNALVSVYFSAKHLHNLEWNFSIKQS